MPHTRFRSEEIAQRGQELYERNLRHQVEVDQNIGKMILIDVETGDYEIDETGKKASEHLHAKHSDAALYGIRIGYEVAFSLNLPFLPDKIPLISTR